jgi:hypothetical protein
MRHRAEPADCGFKLALAAVAQAQSQ